VHGGLRYREPVWLTSDVLANLAALIPLAPDHLPVELAAVHQVSERWPRVPASAAFDTAFHASLPDRARLFGIPRCFSDAGVVRFGFHGLSYEYVVGELRSIGVLEPRLVVAHLGSGASLAAIRDGQSIDTTMGFTPTGGIIMATRSGDLDPGVLLFLARAHDLDPAAISRVVNLDGGLRGLSETTGDMRTLLERSPEDRRAAAAVDIFCYQVSKAIASLAVALGGIDSIVFTGGIGEHAAPVRRRVCESLAWYGVTVDDALNASGRAVISHAGAGITVRIVPTNEELMVVRHTRRLLDEEGDRDKR
jgi:acetate kinase